jgi:glycosyltransferase involved in cell wall biosynthesis
VTDPVRVLHVSQPTHGGVAVCVSNAAADQVRRGWEVAVACPPHSDLAEHLNALEILHLPWDATRSPGPSTLQEARDLRWIVRQLEPDVLHLHSSKAGLAGRLPLFADGTPTIFQPHGWSWLAATGAQTKAVLRWERYAARHRTDALVCVGSGELHQGQAAGVRGPYRLIRNGVDLTKFTPADAHERRAARAELGLPLGVPLAVCVGRITRQKGQDVLLDAWTRVRAQCSRAMLALVGDGDELPALRQAAATTSEGDVLFVPAVTDTRNWLAAAHVVVVPSRWEGLPLVALEAMARGRSLVCSDIPGLAEVVQDGTGAAVPPCDPDALAAAIVHRLSRPADADAEGRAAAEKAAHHDLSRALAGLAALTAELVGRDNAEKKPQGERNRVGLAPNSSR